MGLFGRSPAKRRASWLKGVEEAAREEAEALLARLPDDWHVHRVDRERFSDHDVATWGVVAESPSGEMLGGAGLSHLDAVAALNRRLGGEPPTPTWAPLVAPNRGHAGRSPLDAMLGEGWDLRFDGEAWSHPFARVTGAVLMRGTEAGPMAVAGGHGERDAAAAALARLLEGSHELTSSWVFT